MSALQQALKELRAEYGQGTIHRLGDRPISRPDVIPTGAPTLDVALGIGGLPRGRIVELYGPEASGKTTLLYHLMANAQAMGLTVAMIDAEHAMDPFYAEAIGACTDDLLVSQPDFGEQALEVADRLAGTGEVGLICVDSVAALTPEAELNGEMGKLGVGGQARMMAQAMRKLAGKANRSKTLIVFTNQIRYKVGVVYGSPETQPGGQALKYAASVRMDMRRVAKDGPKGAETGNEVKVTMVKNKMAPPYRVAEFDIVFGTGIDSLGSLIELGADVGVLGKSGSWFSYKGDKLGQPKGARDKLRADQGLRDEITKAVYTAAGLVLPA